MYHERRVRERIIATEIMKLERRQALTRAGEHPLSPPAHSRCRRCGSHTGHDEGGHLGETR
jgi:hypothetical protein